MKSFVATVILALLMGTGILINHFAISNVSDNMESAVEALPSPTDPACADAASTLEKQWKRKAALIHISVNHTIVDRIGEQLATLSACASCGDLYGFYTARAMVLDALEDMRRLERISAVL